MQMNTARHTIPRLPGEGLPQAATLALVSFVAVLLSGCKPEGRPDGSTPTNLSLISGSSFPASTNSYCHLQHLQNLLRAANALSVTNPAIFSQAQTVGKLAHNSPLRPLLGIPRDEPAYLGWWQTMDQRGVNIRSSKTDQRLGEIRVNLQTGRIYSAHDVEALFMISEM
jgi:hypothetical protein